MKISDAGIALLKESEGCDLVAYRDPVGVPTIGYGHTLNIVSADVGKKTISEEEAERLLREDDLPRYEAAVAALVTVDLTQGQYDSLVDFAYNLGCAALANSTLRRKLNKGDYEGAALEFGRWVHGPNGEVLPGLVTRRWRERDMFTGIPTTSAA